MSISSERALLVGCEGGVARAVLSLLESSAAGKALAAGLEALFLVDGAEPEGRVPKGGERLPPLRLESAEDLGRLVREYRITQVVDLSSVDTLDCTAICDELGADFLCTSVEEWAGQPTLPTDEAIARLLPPRRPLLIRQSHLVGSGANPGIVNALVFAGLEAFAARTGLSPTLEALDLYGVYITEEDTTREPGAEDDPSVFPMTWSPTHCLEELFETRAFAAREGEVIELGHRPVEQLYRARCGDRIIEAMAVPHEETATLGWKMPGVELAFLYRLPEAARRSLEAHPERDSPEGWLTRHLAPPAAPRLVGSDRVGVLLASRSLGELWIGFDTGVAQGLRRGTNATQLQVACGVLAGWKQLGSRKGIHFVEDLDWQAYLEVVKTLLGEPLVVYDPTAPFLPLVERRV